MSAAETAMEVAEVVDDALEVVAEAEPAVSLMTRVAPFFRSHKTHVVAAFVIGAAISSELTFVWAKKRLTEVYEARMAQEVKETREFYMGLQKVTEDGEPRTPQQILEELKGEPVPEDIQVAPEPTFSDVPPPGPAKPANVFATPQPTEEDTGPGWDYATELKRRDANPNEPYVISEEEYLEAEKDYGQDSLVYYDGDGVVCDTQSQVVDDKVVGEANLLRFGHGTQDPDTVHIRNDQLEMDFEVVRSNGKYIVEVLDLDDPDEAELKHSDRPRKFRHED